MVLRSFLRTRPPFASAPSLRAQESLRLGLTPNVTKELINFFFGWMLKELARDMQIHYAGQDRPARRLLAQVTMML